MFADENNEPEGKTDDTSAVSSTSTASSKKRFMKKNDTYERRIKSHKISGLI
jgi:hypothetical protein